MEEKKIKTGSDFSGVGALDQALERLGIKQDKKFACDMDKFARDTYVYNYGEPKYYPTDVYHREIPKESLDLYVTSPPCQAFSLAGSRKGEGDERGILFYNSHEFIKENKPRFFIFENVKGLLSDNKGKTFATWCDYLGGKSVNGNPVIFPASQSVPYHIYYKVLNAKNYGIPQNRERVFIIGIRDDKDNYFKWPKEQFLKKSISSVLESVVNKKYFLSDKMTKGFYAHAQRHLSKGNGFEFKVADLTKEAKAITTRSGSRATDNYIKVGYLNQDTQGSVVFDEKGVAPTLCSGSKGYANGYVKIGRIVGRNPENPKARVVGQETAQMLEVNEKGISNCLTTVQKDNVVVFSIPQEVTVRKHDVDVLKLQKVLKDAKKSKSIAEISEALGVKKTTVEHWFRKDTSFSIPPPEIWDSLKNYLNLKTTEFDKYIMTFETKAGIYEKSNRVYSSEGLSPTLTAASADEKILINNNDNFKIRKLTPLECFRLMDFNPSFKWRVSDSQAYKQAGNSICVGVLAAIIKELKF